MGLYGVVAEYVYNNMAEYVIYDQKAVARVLENIEPYVFVKSKHLKLAQKLLILKRNGYTNKSLIEMFNISKEARSLNNYSKRVELDPVTTDPNLRVG